MEKYLHELSTKTLSIIKEPIPIFTGFNKNLWKYKWSFMISNYQLPITFPLGKNLFISWKKEDEMDETHL